jgi:hypothetical protein
MFFESCVRGARLPQQSAKLPEQRPFCFLFFLKKILGFVLVVKQRRERKKEEKFFLLLYSSTSLFLFPFCSSCDLVFFSYWNFFPLPIPFASPHVFVGARWFILTLFMFSHHSCSIARA